LRFSIRGPLKLILCSLAIASMGCDGCGTPASNPPPPPVPATLPPDLAAALPKTDAGLPILLSTPAMLPGGMRIALVFDESLDDPLTRWSECVARGVSCYEVNRDRPIAGCIALIERCADDTGGKGCCPARCLDDFERLLHSGRSESQAFDESIMAGDCVAGYSEFMSVDGGVQP